MTDENGVDFVGLYAGVSNVFWKKKREGRKEVRTYTSSEPRTIRTHPSRRTHFLPFHRYVPLKCTVFSVSRMDHIEEEGMMTKMTRRRRSGWR